MGEDYQDLEPPSPEEVATRALILSVVSCRGFTDTDVENAKGGADLARRSYDWLQAVGLEAELDQWERKLLASPFGSLSKRDRINASWLAEGMTVLAWSLGKIELPGFDEQCDPASVANALGFLQPLNRSAIAAPLLRPKEELSDYNEFIYNVHWRFRDYSLNKRHYDFESLARNAWGDPVIRYGLRIKEEDIAVCDQPLFRSNESDWRPLMSITQERHRASNWLIGYESENFYLVTTDT